MLTKDSSIILKNLSFLTVMRGFNIGVKFFLVAYLIRVLGEVNYGILTWTDSVIQYFIILINFGFNVYAAKYIVDNKGNQQKINTITSAIFSVKLAFFAVSFLFVFLLSFFEPFKAQKTYLMLMLLIGIGEVFFPIWYFQGVEKLKSATFITVFARIILVIGTFIFVKSSTDLIPYIWVLIVSNLVLGAVGYITLVKNYNFSFVKVRFLEIKTFVKESFMFFLGRFLSLTFNYATIFLIGVFCTMNKVSGFDVALKVVLVCIIPFDMLQQAVFPTISRTKNIKMLKKIIVGSFIVGLLFTTILFVFREQILYLFGGEKMVEYSAVLATLSFIPPLVAVTFTLGTCTLVAFGYQKEFNLSLIYSSIFYLILVSYFYITNQITFWSLIWLRVIADLVLMLFRVFYVYKNDIFNKKTP